LILDYQITEYGDGISPDVYEQLERISVSAQMIALTPDVIRSHQRNVVATSEARLVGYAALAGEYVYTDQQGQEYRAIELGGAVVMPDFRRMGVASALLEARLGIMCEDNNYADDTRAVVFTNPTSRPYIERAGFRPLEKDESIDISAFKLCEGCTSCPTVGLQPWQDPTTCCDFEGIRIAVPSEL
jgi:GNAT superfamily N-acetyltransferase